MKEKFTPGPWEISHITGDVVSDDGTIVHEVDSNYVNGSHYKKANAHLIAAAPVMYEALLKCVSADPTIAMNRPGWMDYIASIEGARAALKKARGEQ